MIPGFVTDQQHGAEHDDGKKRQHDDPDRRIVCRFENLFIVLLHENCRRTETAD